MKTFMYMATIAILAIFIAGCAEQELVVVKNNAGNDQEYVIEDTANSQEAPLNKNNGECAFSATAKDAAEFSLVEGAFSNGVSCESTAACYDYLLGTDEYRQLAPEFEPYLECESEGNNDVLRIS